MARSKEEATREAFFGLYAFLLAFEAGKLRGPIFFQKKGHPGKAANYIIGKNIKIKIWQAPTVGFFLEKLIFGCDQK